MRVMLSECDRFGCQYSVKFNATKSKIMLFAAKGKTSRHQAGWTGFCINGQSIDYVDKYVHLVMLLLLILMLRMTLRDVGLHWLVG